MHLLDSLLHVFFTAQLVSMYVLCINPLQHHLKQHLGSHPMPCFCYNSRLAQLLVPTYLHAFHSLTPSALPLPSPSPQANLLWPDTLPEAASE